MKKIAFFMVLLSGCTYEAVYRMGIKVGEICRSGGGNNCQMIYQ